MMIAVNGKARPVNWLPNWEMVSEVQSFSVLENVIEKLGFIRRLSIRVVNENHGFPLEFVAAVDPRLMPSISFQC